MKELEQIYNFNNIFFIKLVRMNIGGPLKFKSDFQSSFTSNDFAFAAIITDGLPNSGVILFYIIVNGNSLF